MSVWSSFLDSIAKPFGKAVGEGGKNVLDFVGQAFPGVPAPANALNQIVLPAAVQLGTSQILNKTNLESSAQAGIKQNLEYNLRTSAASNDLTLKIAHDVVEPIISEGITRPGSTLMLLTDSTSPLYQPGKYEKGFQLNDIKAAYNRSEKVSVFAAMTKSDLMSASIPQATVDYFSDINFKDVNLWDDENLKKNYSDNAVGRYYTGVGDFIVGNVLIAAAGGGVARVAGSIGRAGGISTKGKAITQFEKEINDGFLYTDTVGAQGKFSTAADDFRLISETDDINQIIIRAEKYTDNPRMIDALAEATDKNVIRDLILADKGYAPALERLLKTEPALIGDVANVTTTFKAKALDDGGVYHPEGDALDRINALYNDGMRLPQHKKYYETVMDPQNKSFLGGGRDYFPMEPILGARQLAALKDRVSATKSGLITRDFTDIGGFEERILGNKLITRAIRFTGTYKPLGYVTFSGARPMDGVVELHAMLDDIPLFNSGTNVIKLTPPGIAEKTMKASEYRSKIISDFTRAENNIARKKVLEDIDDSLGLHMGYTHGFFDEDAIRNFTQLLRGRISNSHNQFSTKGMGIDAQGRRVTTDPYTQRQLVESYRLAPWNIIEKEIRDAAESRALKRSGTKMADASKAIFENINRYWTFDVLARPSYIPKQSLAEPILSAFLAQGLVYVADAVPTMTRNILKNNRNRVLGVASKIHNRSELKSIQDVVEAKSTQLDIAVNQLNTLTAEYASFITDSISPASRFYNGPKVKKALDDAQNLVDEIELDLMSAVKPFGRMEPVPTLASLERRIEYLENLSVSITQAKYGQTIANAKAALGASRGELNTLILNPAGMLAKNKEVATQYELIDKALKELGESYVNEANLLGKSAKYKERYTGKQDNYRMVGGKWTRIDKLTDENHYGAAMKEELSNNRTVETTYLGESSVGTRQSVIMRKAPDQIVDVSNPLYFEELAYVINRAFRGDPLVNKILSNVNFKDLVAWGQSPSGIAYMEQFGGYTIGSVPDFIRSRVSFVNRYIPNKAVQAKVLEGEVTSNQLKMMMGKDLERLSAIHPTEFNYQAAAEGFVGVKGLQVIDKVMADIARGTFRRLASPENPIRWAFADKVFLDIMAKKANVLADQGIVITDARLNALRQSATIEAVKETEKVFYTIRRQNRALYAARAVSAFPTASLNAFYRYGRMAIKNPTRVAGFLHSYNSMFTSFGIDEYGNPVEDAKKATHIVLPGSKEMGWFGGKGVRLSARSIGFLLNIPGPSFFAAVPVGKLMKWKPEAEETVKNLLGSNYDVFFPYGPQDSVKRALTPTWADALIKYLTTPESDADFLNSVKSVANYYRTLDEMGIQKFPGLDTVRNDARNLYGQKAQWSFASIFGVPIKIDNDPMKLYEDYYSILVNKWRTKGEGEMDAKFLAGQELLATLGTDFPLDRVTYKGVSSRAYIPSNIENYNRVFVENNDLISELANLDPKLVELVTLDVPSKPEDFNLSIYKILNDPKTKLPGNVLFNKIKLSPEQEETERQKNRVYNEFKEKKEQFTSLALSQGKKSLQAAPELEQELNNYARDVLSKKSPEWFDQWNSPNIKDNSYRYAKGLETIVNNSKFMAAHGGSKLWSDVQGFISIRNMYTNVYKSLPANDSRKPALKNAYLTQLADNISQWEPPLQELINRYFIKDNMKPTRVEVK
jgi:hypothetical protein